MLPSTHVEVIEDTLRRSDGDGIGQRAHIALDCAPGNTGTHAFACNFSLVSLPKARGVTASQAKGAPIVNVCVFDALYFEKLNPGPFA